MKIQDLHFCGGQKKHAEGLVLKYHYSHRIPVNIVFIGSFHKDGGLFGDQGDIVAACFFSLPQAKWNQSLVELTRLVRTEEQQVPLSRLISLSMKELKRQGHDLVISYADKTQGHEGYVYRACSWNYHGCNKEASDGVIIDGTFIPGRTSNALYGTRSVKKLKVLFPDKNIEDHFDKGKHLYWKALNKKGWKKAKILNLGKKPYQKNHLAHQGR